MKLCANGIWDFRYFSKIENSFYTFRYIKFFFSSPIFTARENNKWCFLINFNNSNNKYPPFPSNGNIRERESIHSRAWAGRENEVFEKIKNDFLVLAKLRF